MHTLAMATVLNEEATSSVYTTRKVQQRGSDSGMIGIDNRCSTCMSHDPADFVEDLKI